MQGVPILWDPTIATIKFHNQIQRITWSPCNKFIAMSLYDVMEIQILDAVTLKQLKSFTTPEGLTQLLTFSPKSRFLTWFGTKTKVFISWDLQTGVQISEILTVEERERPAAFPYSITYSGCGMMFGALLRGQYTNAIGIYDILSSTCTHYHLMRGWTIDTIWTHGECFQFDTLGSEFLTIWEVGFTLDHPPTEVRSLPIPHNFSPPNGFLFFPTLSRLAFALKKSILIWDAQHSKLLLDSAMDVMWPRNMTFSSDGQFFAHGADGPEIYLWKESPTGYILHQKFTSGTGGPDILRLSPNGQLIFASNDSTLQLQLWCTTNSTTSPSSVPTQASQHTTPFILRFSPDGLLAVTTKLRNNTATVLDLNSGLTQLIIDAGMEIHDLGVTGNIIIVVGNGKVVTWNLPEVGHILNTRVDLGESIQTTAFNRPVSLPQMYLYHASISPDFNQIAVMGMVDGKGIGLDIYDVSTGRHLADTPLWEMAKPWFTLNGHEVWCGHFGGYKRWAIVKDSKSGITKLEHLDPAESPPGGFSWQSSCGYQVTDDGWILSSSGKQLLWLPHHWRSSKERVWGGKFLAFLHFELPDVVILELPEE